MTDLESSTRLWESHEDEMRVALATHDQLLRAAIDDHGGYVFATGGDGLCAAFGTPVDAVGAAVDAQRELRTGEWPDPIRLTSRMGIHTGVADERGGDYFGPTVNRTARICAAGHGGQVLISSTAADLLDDAVELHDLGAHRLRDLLEPVRLSQVVVDGDRDAYPPLVSLDRHGHNLPVVRTTFLGREEEVDELSRQLRTSRIVTLTGVGGVGKTRLALEVAASVVDGYDTVVFVDLGPVESADAVVAAVLTSAGLPVDDAPAGQLDKLVHAWRSRSVLVIMDNCEHLLDASAALVDRVTADAPRVDVLATSREALGIGGERVHRVPTLGRATATELFVERATAVRPELARDPLDVRLIEEICERLDDLPLAVELAAARVAHLGLAEIAEHLDERFRLLTGGRRRAVPRQQTLQAAVDWSYSLLDEDERSLLRATAVFVGGFDLAAVAAVWGRDELETLDQLAALVDRSLVTIGESGAGAARYRLLETIRLFAQERLVEAGEADHRRQAHAEHVLDVAVRHAPRMVDAQAWGTDPGDRADLDNHLAALDRFDQQGDLPSVGRLAGRLTTVLGYGAWADTTGSYLQRDDIADALTDPAERALYLTASATNANYLGAYPDQLRLSRSAVDLADDPGTRGAAAIMLANAYTIFHPDRVARLVEEVLPTLPDGATNTTLHLHLNVGMALVMQGRLDDAIEEFERLVREGNALAASELLLVRHVVGRDLVDDTLVEALEDRPGSGGLAYRLPMARALAAATSGAHDEATRGVLEAAELIETYPMRVLDRDILVTCAALAHHRGDVRRASFLLAVTGGQLRTPGSFAVYRHYRDLVRTQLDTEDRRAITAQAAERQPLEVLEEELDRLRDSLTP